MTPILFNNNENPAAITYNGQEGLKVYYNNNLVWEKKRYPLRLLQIEYKNREVVGTNQEILYMGPYTTRYALLEFEVLSNFTTATLYFKRSDSYGAGQAIRIRMRVNDGTEFLNPTNLSMSSANSKGYTTTATKDGWEAIVLDKTLYESAIASNPSATKFQIILGHISNNPSLYGQGNDNLPYIELS